MASAPVLSVVVPTRDRNALLGQALASVAAVGSGGLAIETIVVDTSTSGPGASAVAADFGATLLRLPGGGAAAGRNLGMAAARGEYLLFLDDDDVLLPGHVRPHLELLGRRADLAGVFGQVRLTDFDLGSQGEPFPGADEVGDFFAYLLGRCQQIGSLVVRTSVRETVGPQDESLEAGEEWDWTLRLARRHELGFVEVPCLLFRQRPAGSSDPLNWKRLRYVRQVFVANAWRAGRRRPSLPRLAGMFLRHNGLTASHFLISVRVHAQAGRMAAARFAFRSALASSPPHTVWLLARQRGLLGLAARSHLAWLALPRPLRGS